MIQPTDKVREAFEAWLQSTVPMHNTRNIYSNGERDTAFAAWQASRTAALNEAIELFNARGLQQLLNPSPQDIIKELNDVK